MAQTFSQEQIDEFEALAKPLIEWINNNGDPHKEIIIDCDSARIVSGEVSIVTEEYIKD